MAETLLDVNNGTVAQDMADADTNFTTILAYLNEIIDARDGESNLLAQIDILQAGIAALGSANGPLAEYIASRFNFSDEFSISTTATEMDVALKIPDWKTTAFTAVAFGKYGVAAGVTATLNSSPIDKDRVWFIPLGDMSVSNATIGANGKKIMGLSEDMAWDVNIPFSLIYYATNGDWRFA